MPDKNWLTSTNEILEHICADNGGEQLPTIEHEVGHDGAPLTSHIFMLDMANRLPPDAA
jgi:hypothetical protein